MPDFSVVSQSPQIQAIVQQNALERAFHDALFPNMLFRLDVEPEEWECNSGDNRTFTAPGLMSVNMTPIAPGTDPLPQSYNIEQWTATAQKYANSTDTNMPTSINAIVDLFLRNAQQLGLNAAQTMNGIVRDREYNGGLSGRTTAYGTQATTSSLVVDRLNGFTTARNPNLPAGSQVQFAPVSATNPLPIHVGSTLATAVNVIGFTPVTAGDQVGPGTLLLDATVSVTDRDPVVADDGSLVIYQGGGTRTDDIGSTDILTLSSLQQGVANLRNDNVPVHADGRYHTHLSPVAEQQIFQDTALQNLLKSLPEYYMTLGMAIGELYGSIFFRNQQCPQVNTVAWGASNTYSVSDPYGGLLYSNNTKAGTKLQATLTTGAGYIYEYYQDLGKLITDAGITGKVGKWSISNNNIMVMCDRVQMILRAPLNRTQDQVSTTWMFIGDWPVRTDAATGGSNRYKRASVVLSAS